MSIINNILKTLNSKSVLNLYIMSVIGVSLIAAIFALIKFDWSQILVSDLAGLYLYSSMVTIVIALLFVSISTFPAPFKNVLKSSKSKIEKLLWLFFFIVFSPFVLGGLTALSDLLTGSHILIPRILILIGAIIILSRNWRFKTVS